MALPFPIAPSQTDAKSPIDDDLMDSIRLDLDYLDANSGGGGTGGGGGAGAFNFNVNGPLYSMNEWKSAIDTAVNYADVFFTASRAVIKKSGPGALIYDIRKHTTPNATIKSILAQFSALTQSISRVNPAIATQSIARATPSVSTQSISLVKPALNILSIVKVGTDLWQYNLSGTVDSDYKSLFNMEDGATVSFTGATDVNNNKVLGIFEKNRSGGNNIVVNNPAGVAQLGPAGTAQYQMISYNYVNPVSSEFVAGEKALMVLHSNANNNGQKYIYAVNKGGNNIIHMFKSNVAFVPQPGVAGTADVNRMRYSYLAPVTSDFAVGEYVKGAGHTSGANDDGLSFQGMLVTGVNTGGNNLTLYNESGTIQVSAAGNMGTNRYIYTFLVDPSTQVTAGDSVSASGHTGTSNNITGVVKQVNRSAGLNIVLYNWSGVAQATAAGTVSTGKKVISFFSDLSSAITTDSFLQIYDSPISDYNSIKTKPPFKVTQVNRGGGAAYNAVIDTFGLSVADQLSPAGVVAVESKSIFTSPVVIPESKIGSHYNDYVTSVSTALVPGTILAGIPLGLYILSTQSAPAEDFTVTLY